MERTALSGVAPADAGGDAAGGLHGLRGRLEPLGRVGTARWCEAVTWLASLTAVWTFAGFALRRHRSFESTAYDFGFFDQIVWNTSHGRWFETSFVDYNFLGQHVEPVLLIFAGFYRLGAGPESLLVAQSALVGAAALPLFYAVRRLTGSPVAAMCLAAAFLLSAPLHAALDFDFHPELMAFFFVFTAFRLLADERPLASALALAPILLLKEDMTVVLATFGLLVWMRGHRREGAGLVLVAAAWAIVTLFVLMPIVRGGESDLNERYAYLAEDTTMVTVLPIALWRGIAHLVHETAPALSTILAGTGGIPLLHPAVLLALPSIILNGGADHDQQAQLDLQYGVAPLAWLFVAAALGVGAVARGRSFLPRNAASVIAAAGLVAAVAMFALSSPFSLRNDRYAPSATHRQVVREALTLIRPEAGVTAQNTLLPHLSQRAIVYEFPDVRASTAYVIVDSSLPITQQSSDAGYDDVLGVLIDWGFAEIFNRDGVRVFERQVPQ